MPIRKHETHRSFFISLALFVLALAPRLPGLAVFLTADEPKAWFGRSIQFLGALATSDWAATFDSPAPGVTTMWSGAIGLLLDYAGKAFPGGGLAAFLAGVPFDPLDPAILPLIRLPIVLVVSAAAPLTFLWGRRFLGQHGAILAAVLLALDPFLLALSRILGHDALVSVFMWLSLLAFLRAIQKDSFERRFLVVSGMLGGLAFLTKYPSLFLGAFVAVCMIALQIGWKRPWRRLIVDWLVDITLWSVAAGLVFVILWPAMWVDPLGRVLAIFNDALRASGSAHQKGLFYLGQAVDDPGGGFYFLVTLFRTTPVVWLGLLVAGVALVTQFGRRRETTWWPATGVLLAYVLLYGLLVTFGGKKQDRYILPAFPALAALAAWGYVQLAGLRPKLRFGWLLAAVVLVQGAFVLPHYPYYFTYYNPLAGGGPAAERTIMVGWGEGLDRAAGWLNKLPDAENIDVVAWYSTTFEPYFNGNAIYKIEDEKISRTSKPGLAADYVVFYVNQLQRELPSSGALQFFRSWPAAHVVSLHGVDYAWIYPSLGVQHVIPDEVRLVGQAELLAYDLTGEAGQALAETYPDTVAYLSLFWEWQGKLEDEPIRISMLDDEGNTRGWGNYIQTTAPLPYQDWQQGMVVRDDFALAVFADTLPGDYHLAAWIERPATGETVGVFPLEDRVKIRVVSPEGD